MTLLAEDRIALHELVALHGHLVDAGELERLHEVFVDEVVYDLSDLGGGVLRGLEAIRDAALQLGDGNPIAHHVTNVVVSEQDEHVVARSKFLGVRSDGGVGSGTYTDVLRRTPSGWRIAERRISMRRRPLTP